MEIIEIQNLTSKYNNHTAIDNISFSVAENEYVFLVGENGSGKSTLIKSLVGLHKPSIGNIKLNISKNDIAYLSQNNMVNITFPATAKEIIMTGTQAHKKFPFYTKEDYTKFEKVCKTLKIQDILGKRIGDLSGGQRQRVMLGRALIREPKLLVLDEPFSGLDSKITLELYKILDKLHKESNITIIMASHDIEEIKTMNARVIYLATTLKFDGDIKDWKGLEWNK